MKNLKNYVRAGALALAGLASCGEPGRKIVLEDSPLANGYDVMVEELSKGRYTVIRIGDYNKESDSFNYGNDGSIFVEDNDGDRRIDNIGFGTVREGSPLEELVCLPKLNSILKQALEEK